MLKKNLLFYEIMKYPVPTDSHFFSFEEKTETPVENNTIDRLISRKDQNNRLSEYSDFINKFWWLYRSLPFISNIYICNSISFNRITEESDIDIFIITKEKCLRRARFFSWIFFKVLFLKRWQKNKKKKFCLSFYTTQDNTNLYNILLPKTDIYLIYRLAHLVPIYQEEKYNIYTDNKRLISYLPSFPQKHIINIWTKLYRWNNKFKKTFEFIFWWVFWKIFEYLIKSIRLPIVIYKKNKLKEKWRGIIINDKMLKYHEDKRKKIHTIFKSYNK